MFYTVYKITNLVNNKIYIGVHKTSNLEDDYMGSGLLIKNSIKKYGLENFKKEYISIFDNAEDMFNMESELVNEEFIKRSDVYNLSLGGSGGDKSKFIDYKKRSLNPLWKQACKDNGKKGIEKIKLLSKNDSGWIVNRNNRLSESLIYYYENNGLNGFSGKSHSEETKRKIGEINSKLQSGEGNSQFGTMWIHNIELKQNKKIKKDEFSSWEQEGWIKGRKMKI